MNTSKNVFLALVLSLAFSLTGFAQAATTPADAGTVPPVKQTGLQKLDMTGAPKLQFFKSIPAQVAPANPAPSSPTPDVKTPATPADTNTTQAVPANGPATPAVTPGTSPDITPKQVEDFLEKHGMDADKAKAASNPTPAMLDEEFMNIWTFIGQKYYNGDKLASWQVWPAKYQGKLNTREDLSKAVATMLASLNDRWTTFTSIEAMLRGQEMAKTGLLYLGIGLAANSNGTFRVEAMEYASPAWNTNSVRPGDIVKSVTTTDVVNGKAVTTTHDLTGMTKEDASKLLMGKKGDKVTLVLNHDGKDDSVDMAFDETAAEQIEVGMLPNHIGYVRLPSFGTSEDEANALGNGFLQALAKLDGAANGHLTGIVLDLRANHGGAVDLAKKIARIFIDHGTFLQTQEREGGTDKFEKDVFRSQMPYEYLGAPKQIVALFNRLHTVPLTVLVDGSSASSAEILTGTLKDNKRAVVIGTQTFGKAVAFVRIPMTTGMLQVTTMHYLTPNGYDLANKGIQPDIVLDRTRGANAVDEQLVMAAQVLLTANNNLSGQPDPDAQTQGSDDAFGSESLLGWGLGLGLMLLTIVLTLRHNKLRKRRDEQEKNDRK
jgi:carboxyl-terminal processing protease